MSYDALGTRARPTLGLDTFGDVPLDADGRPGDHPEVIRQVVAEGVLADRVGVDYLGLGEHHRPDYAVSAPDVVLGGDRPGQTERIRLGTGVTVLSSDDPIRVYQRFATLDAIAPGRAEVQIAGARLVHRVLRLCSACGWRTTTGCSPSKLDLFRPALQSEGSPVTWEGTIRPPLQDKQRLPRPPRPVACPRGSRSAARRSRWSGRRATRCRWCWP